MGVGISWYITLKYLSTVLRRINVSLSWSHHPLIVDSRYYYRLLHQFLEQPSYLHASSFSSSVLCNFMASSWVKFLPHDFSMNATLRERILWGGFFGPKGGIFQIQVSHGADDEFMIPENTSSL